MNEHDERSRAWLAQAVNDLAWGADSLRGGYFAQSCFVAQQVAEKALKALAFHRGADVVKSHSVRKIAQDLDITSDILEAARVLDLYYVSSRYPDALPEHAVPAEAFGRKQAEEALALAEGVLNRVKGFMLE
jgi:HEPN domain-containing protein